MKNEFPQRRLPARLKGREGGFFTAEAGASKSVNDLDNEQ